MLEFNVIVFFFLSVFKKKKGLVFLCRYHGEKLSNFQPFKKPRPDFHISTVYDEPKDIDRGDTLLRRQPSTSLKHTYWHPKKITKPQS